MDEDLVRKMVGQKSGELLASVRQDFTIGITWGRTIAHMIESISGSGLKVRKSPS